MEGLSKHFQLPYGIEVAVDDITLDVKEGEFLTLLGPSGCGKTTTLRCIAGLEKPTSGSIYFDDHDITELPGNKREIAMMFQNIALYPHMKIVDNISYPLKVKHVPKDERHVEAEKAAETMQIADLLEKYPGEVSGGQRQRAALARTIVQDPEAFLMDEPLSDLDAKLKAEIQDEIQRVHKRLGKPTIYVTHDQQEALKLSDRIAVMHDGKIIQVGTPRDIYTRPKNRFIAEFIGNPSMNFVQGEVVTNNADIMFKHSRQEIRFEGVDGNSNLRGEGILGFRPQRVTLTANDDKPDFTGIVELIDPLDDRMLITLNVSDSRIKGIVDWDDDIITNQEVGVSLGEGDVYLFHPENGELMSRLRKGEG